MRIGLVLVSVIASGFLLGQLKSRNRAFSQALSISLIQPTDHQSAMSLIEPLTLLDCRIHWQISLLAIGMDTPPDIETDLQKMLECSPDSVDWLYLMAPERVDLASRAAQLYPQDAQIWLWLGDLAKTDKDLALATAYFTESTRLDPDYGLAWCRLGTVKESQGQLQAAMEALWQCCQNGDPGSNGCNGAGRVAEKLGDIPTAIQYYRRSHWQPALDRADELESSQ